MSDEVTFVHDTGFLEAFSNTDHTVFGRRLDPFCLWHKLNLERVQAKVMTGGAMTALDLWTAVQICTTPWSPGFRQPNLAYPGLVRFFLGIGRYNVRTEAAKFSAYLLDYSVGPKFWPNQHESREGSDERDIDDSLELALHLLKEGFSWREAWTMPLGAARWCSAGLSKLAGNKLDIWTPQHEARFEEHKKNREAKIDARGREIADAEKVPYEVARKKADAEYWAQVKENQAYASALSKLSK